MHCLRSLSRLLTTAALALAAWLVVGADGFAQAVKTAEKTGGATTGTGPYVMAYMLLVLAIGISLAVVCTSSNRRDRAAPEGFVKSTLVDDDDKKPSPKGKK